MSTQVQKSMPYVRLGKSGLKVSKIILGCMSYGSSDWQPWILKEEEGIAHIKAAYDAGINTFDTANVYSNGASEVVLGKAIKAHNLPRDEIVVLTKVRFAVGRTGANTASQPTDELDASGYVNQYGLSRKHIFESVKHSLERLQLEYVDVLQCHRFDYDTPIEETMQALHDVNYAISHNLTPFIAMQNQLSLAYREEEREMMPTLKHFGVGSIPWSPLARGLLTRPIGEQTKRAETDPSVPKYLKVEGDKEMVGRIEAIAKEKNVSMAQVALAWVMQKDGVTAPIVGTTSLENLKDLLGAVQLKLSAEEVKSLEELYQPRAVFGHF
ncbi:aryl-alcohol dehydrogenase [Athelia psychrophila]|uniref:Aryl-alcohol dehydrogenase n=1 Tax=Athelia psychrophila TaxID=1759441 RepID=A0A166C483_9AGAM|nr:aryl-alcohol dehydrogenase [Fibularhizoctonia sp. CBS 109695]